MIEVVKEGPNAYSFSLKTSDGNTLLHSIRFKSREEVNAVIDRLNSLMENQSVFERKTNHQGKFLFQLRDMNGRLLGSSQLYHSEAGMENGIKNLRNNIASLPNSRQS